MLHILGVLFLLFLSFIAIGFSILRKIARTFTGSNKHQSQQRYSNQNSSRSQDNYSNSKNKENLKSKQTKKIFGDDEGEYVDFEEVKED